jgi:hypothetical protein
MIAVVRCEQAVPLRKARVRAEAVQFTAEGIGQCVFGRCRATTNFPVILVFGRQSRCGSAQHGSLRRNASITRACSAALTTRSTWPPSWICTVAVGNSRLMSSALANGMMGSSVPATISVGCRINGSSGMLVQPASNRGAGDVPVPRCHTAGARRTRHVRLQRRHRRTRGTRPRMRGEEVDYPPGRRHRR